MRVGALFSSVATIAILAGSLSFGGDAYARAAVDLSSKANWSVNNVQDASSPRSSYCTLAKRFTGDLVVTFAENGEGETSFALDFPQGNFNISDKFSITLDPGVGQRRVFNASPVTNRAFVLRLGRDERFFEALAETGNLNAMIGGQGYNFDLSDIRDGRGQLSACIARITPAPVKEYYAPVVAAPVRPALPPVQQYVESFPPVVREPVSRVAQPVSREIALPDLLPPVQRYAEDLPSMVDDRATVDLQLPDYEPAPRVVVSEPLPLVLASDFETVPALPSVLQPVVGAVLREEVPSVSPYLAEDSPSMVSDPVTMLVTESDLPDLPDLPLSNYDEPFPIAAREVKVLKMPPGVIGDQPLSLETGVNPLVAGEIELPRVIEVADVRGSQRSVPPVRKSVSAPVEVDVPHYTARISSLNDHEVQSSERQDEPYRIDIKRPVDNSLALNRANEQLQAELRNVKQQNEQLRSSVGSLQALRDNVVGVTTQNRQLQEALDINEQILVQNNVRNVEAARLEREEAQGASVANDVLRQSLESLTNDVMSSRALLAEKTAEIETLRRQQEKDAQYQGVLEVSYVSAVPVQDETVGLKARYPAIKDEDIASGIEAVQNFTDIGLNALYSKYGYKIAAVSTSVEFVEVQELVAEPVNLRQAIEVEALLEPERVEDEPPAINDLPEDMGATAVDVEMLRAEDLIMERPVTVSDVSLGGMDKQDVGLSAEEEVTAVEEVMMPSEQGGELDVSPEQIIDDELLILEEVLGSFEEVVEVAPMLGVKLESEAEAEIPLEVDAPPIALTESQRSELLLMHNLRQEFEAEKVEDEVLEKDEVIVEIEALPEVLEEVVVIDVQQPQDPVELIDQVIEVEKISDPVVLAPIDVNDEMDAEPIADVDSAPEIATEEEPPALHAGDDVMPLLPPVDEVLVDTVVVVAQQSEEMAPSGGVETLLSAAGIVVSGRVEMLDSASVGGVEVYQWETTNSLYGSSEQRAIVDAYEFDGMALAYLERAQSRCPGEFAVALNASEDGVGRRVDSYDIACVGESADSAAAIIFFSTDGVFSVIAHEAEISDMSAVMDVRDRLIDSIL